MGKAIRDFASLMQGPRWGTKVIGETQERRSSPAEKRRVSHGNSGGPLTQRIKANLRFR